MKKVSSTTPLNLEHSGRFKHYQYGGSGDHPQSNSCGHGKGKKGK